MKSIWLLTLAPIFALVNTVSANDVIKVGVADGNVNVLELKDGRFVGSVAKFYQCAFDNIGLDFEFRLYPHARILHNLESGEIDIGLPLVKVSDRDKYADFPRGFLDVKFLLYSFREIGPDDDLSDFTFTVRRATASKDLVVARGGRYEEVSSWEQAVRLAQIKRFDGAVIPEIIAAGIPAENYSGLNRSQFGTIPLALYVSHKSPHRNDLVARFDRAIGSCGI